LPESVTRLCLESSILHGTFDLPEIRLLELHEILKFPSISILHKLKKIVIYYTDSCHLERCPDLRALLPELKCVEISGSVQSAINFFKANPWVKEVVISGHYCCPENLASLPQLISVLEGE